MKEQLNNRFSGQNVVITGGSSGIGLEMARRFVLMNAQVHLIARNPEKLQQAVAGLQGEVGSVKGWPCDVSDREAVEETLGQIATAGGIHTLINNAGISHVGYFDQVETNGLEKVMQVNYWGAVYATKAAWPYLVAAKDGLVAFVSSVAGFTGIIGFPGYGPSKFAMTGLAETLRMEGVRAGVQVSILFPPDTDTPMLAGEMEGKPWECIALSENANLMSPEAVVGKFLKGIGKRRYEITCNFESRQIQVVKGIAPRLYYWILDRIVKKGGEKRKRRVETRFVIFQSVPLPTLNVAANWS